MSGTPAVAFAIPAPLMYSASKPARSTCRAIAAFGTPGSATQPLVINSRNLPGLVCSIRLFLLLLWLGHFHRPHQFADIFRIVQFPHKIDNLPGSFFT